MWNVFLTNKGDEIMDETWVIYNKIDMHLRKFSECTIAMKKEVDKYIPNHDDIASCIKDRKYIVDTLLPQIACYLTVGELYVRVFEEYYNKYRDDDLLHSQIAFCCIQCYQYIDYLFDKITDEFGDELNGIY